ncbi:MAG: multiple sugar transport system substrate-binding protein [Frankiales bacterium]|nr:multiple sugar transport system substrate-binding protein [Frankiales bacterium]
MRLNRIVTTSAIGLLLAPLAACGGSSSSTGSSAASSPASAAASAASSAAGASASGASTAAGSSSSATASGKPVPLTGVTLTYWASNQGTSLANDTAVLTPQLNKFTAETGIKVSLEVVPWSDLLNRILAAATSGKGPDVLNIGNTWSPTLQATGAFTPFNAANLNAVGGKARFLAGSMSATGAPGQDPVAVPIYSLAYGLYYNKKMFAAAGITNPPATWDEFAADAKKLTTGSQYGLSEEGGSTTENIHNAFTLAAQNGGSFYDSSGKPTFNTPGNVAGILQYLDFMQKDKVVNISDAEYSNGTEALKDFATGKSAMVMWQAAAGSLKQFGMNSADIGVVPVPLPATMPAGGKKVTSMVAGINLAIFKASSHQKEALEFAKFMTSTPTQETLNATYGSLPSVSDAYSNPAFETPAVTVFKSVLATTAAPLPETTSESQFETLVGTSMKTFFSEIASGKTVTSAEISKALAADQQQLAAS